MSPQGREPSSDKVGEAQKEPRHRQYLSIEVAEYTRPSSALEGEAGDSMREHLSPFTPNAVGVRRGFRTISPNPVTPITAGSTGEHPAAAGKRRSTRREKEKLERKAAPEKTLTLFAMRLAVLEKIASNVGTLAFIWATVVLLGGFAITLKEIDFWFVTVILVTEGARIFSRSHELEWQHQDAGTAAESLFVRAYHRSSDVFFKSTSKIISTLTTGRNGADQFNSKLQALENPQAHAQNRIGRTGEHHLTRTWSVSGAPIIPILDWIFCAKHISRLLYWMQIISACVATGLSVYRLHKRHFTRESELVDTVENHSAALLIFYSMATFESLVFLLERSYWQFQISSRKILVRVNKMCGLETRDLGTTRRFFYDVYSKCLTESIFEGLKIDMVDYALNWLQSDIPGEQLGGLRVLFTFSSNTESMQDTLRSIGVKQGAVERLVEMVTWKNASEYEIRKAAADLLCKLVKYNQYSIRVAAISGSIEGIFSLLSADADDNTAAEYARHAGASEVLAPKHLEMHTIGLRILKNLGKDPLICAKIGVTRGLLACLISFIDTNGNMRCNADKILLVKKSLELLSLLASASGSSGKMLREEIGKIVFTISNLRVILEYGQAHMMLQDLATEILCSMAMDDGTQEMIGRTGGMMHSLFALLIKERGQGDIGQLRLAQKAGEVLALLALKSKDNCLKMLRLKVQQGRVVMMAEEGEAYGSGSGRDMVAELIERVADWEVGYLAMNILRSFCAYSEHASCKARIAQSSMKVFKLAVERSGKAQEAALGLLAETVAEVGEAELGRMLEEGGLSAEELAGKLVRLLEKNRVPIMKLPRLRRFGVELALALAEHHPTAFLPAFHALKFRSLLHGLADSVSELENFATFSGVAGVTPHKLSMSRLVDITIDKFQYSS